MERPDLDEPISVKDFKDFYWLKKELVAFCKRAGISTKGGKPELSEKIIHYLSTGTIPIATKAKAAMLQSSFGWSNEELKPTTVITDNYKNTENVRAFFTKAIGKRFSFNVKFMNWMKANTGKTLQDAIQEWKRLTELKKDKSITTDIAPQFEYNRYVRAFLADNPSLTMKEAMKCWKLKRAQRGTNEYEKSDLEMK